MPLCGAGNPAAEMCGADNPAGEMCGAGNPAGEKTLPELPDVTIYIEALERRIAGHTLNKVRLANPFVLRTVEPSPRDVAGKRVAAIRRVGKRIVLGLEDD